MPPKDSVSRLPDEIKAYIQAMLASGAQTLDELIADLRERFPAQASAGELPSRSAIGRYGQKLDRRLAAIRASTEAAKLIQANAGDDNDARSEALTALVQTELFEAILMFQEADGLGDDGKPVDPADRVELLSKAARNIATLTGSSVRLKKFQGEVKAKAEAAAATVDKLARTGGLSADTAAAIRREILGIAA
jgi:hypothetical protein